MWSSIEVLLAESRDQLFWTRLQTLPFGSSYDLIVKNVGRDEKGCKMDVDRRRRASTVDGLEKCSLVDVDQEKCSGIDVDRHGVVMV